MTSVPGGEAGGGGSFEDRLRVARARRGLEESGQPPAAAPDDAGPSAMAIGLRVGVELVSAFAVAVAIGWALDRWLHTGPVLLVVFVLLGGAAGIANVWRLMGRLSPKGQGDRRGG
jgi:ATP synthase protein I